MAETSDKTRSVATFDHPKNIQIGVGRVIWATGESRLGLSGWVLPGGERTQDVDRASNVAFNINKIAVRAAQ